MNIIIDSYKIHFSTNFDFVASDKTTIIFLHDSLGCIELWRDFPEKIASQLDCNSIVYDRLGYGKSDGFASLHRDKNYLKQEAKMLGLIIDHFSLKNVVLFGHSDGGSIALLAASLFPEKIKGIITEGAHIFVEEKTLQGIKEATTAYKETNLKDRLTKYHGKHTEPLFRMWTDTWLSKDFKDWNIEKCLPTIYCPSLIIQGENDEYGTLKQVEKIAALTTGPSSPLIIPEIGHTPHKECPEVVIANTLRFITKIISTLKQ